MRPLDDLSLFDAPEATVLSQRSSIIYNGGTRPENRSSSCSPNEFMAKMNLYCQYAGKSELKKFFIQRRLRQDFFSLEYIVSGEFYIQSGNTGYVAEAGDLCLLHPGMRHGLLFQGKGKCVKYGCILSGKNLIPLLKMFQLENVGVLPVPDPSRLSGLFDELCGILERPMTLPQCEKNASRSFELLQMISDFCGESQIPEEIAGVIGFLQEHYSEPVAMKELASKFGWSLPAMNRHFFSAMRLTPYQYLIRLRMQQAVFLLQSSRYSVKEIAERVGYRNPLYFSSEFRRLQFCSPREYRNSFSLPL